MLKRPITYENFDDEEVTEIFYFNLSHPELIEMEVEHKQGMGKIIQRIVDTRNDKELIKIFKDLVLKSYGEKSEDGRRFIKSDELREGFSQTAAYSALFMDLVSSDDAAVEFLNGILPRDMRGVVTKEAIDQKKKELTGQDAAIDAKAKEIVGQSKAPLPPTAKG